MHRTSPGRVRRQVRWTLLERGLIAFAALLMMLSAGVEIYRWAQPPGSYAEELAPVTPTNEPPTATNEPATATNEPATATNEPATATSEPPTATSEPPIATTEPPTATNEPPTATALPEGSPTLTPLPTLVITDPPLTLDPWATVASVKRGDQFSYIISIGSASEVPRTIEVRNSVNDQLDILEAGASNGACTPTNPVVCTLTASKSAPAQITINVRVHTDAALGSLLVSQTLARDDQLATAASERVTVIVTSAVRQADVVPTATITPSPVPATHTPKPTKSAPPSNTAQPPAATSPASATNTAQSAAASSTPEVVAAGSDQATQVPVPPTPTTTSATPAAQSAATPALPPTLEPAAPAPDDKPVQPTNGGTSNLLPDTAATTPTFGLGIGLLGLALTIHGARRVRRADTQLTSASAAIARLSPLVDQANEFQGATVAEIERMRNESAAMIDTIAKKQRGE